MASAGTKLFKTISTKITSMLRLLFLALCHGIVLSIRTIKRVLKRLNLRTAHGNGSESPVECIVLQELENSSDSFLGYLQMTQRLRQKYNFLIRR